jgi:hypothetical protein
MNPFEAIIPLGAFAMFSWMVYIIVDSFRRRQHLRIMGEFHTRLLDRVGTAGELVEFFSTESGTRFLQSLNTERSPAGAHVRILRATQAGIVLVALGLGLFGLMAIHAKDYPRQVTENTLMFGTIVFFVGLGLLVSAAVSWRLSKRLGLLAEPDTSRQEPPPAA